MPPILDRPRRESGDAEWRADAGCLVRDVGVWRQRTADREWVLPRPIRSRGPAHSAAPRSSVRLEVQFENLADEWERATDFESVVVRKAMHPAYQRIIGMGNDAVPLILRRLQREPRQWFWALSSITGEDPAEGETTADGAAEAWLNWGRLERFVVD